ncbi:hypothetical protein JOF53_000346 [Crossiella equi]|uniref:Restriction endonuclease type IV Mrr domain-containing protein n=1 Tax=Crossiella equi TaxID=130796 RepID=A0ABS5A5G3_9PSEU|nr:hypothetical protein [Crossiella equi]MBP2471474.1 hypothetical protein [Crossiella equi]
MRGDEQKVVEALCAWLRAEGWTVATEIEWIDVVATRPGEQLLIEAKGHDSDPGAGTDVAFGQLLRRMASVDDPGIRYALAVRDHPQCVNAAARVSQQVLDRLRITLYAVAEDGGVRTVPGGQTDPAAVLIARAQATTGSPAQKFTQLVHAGADNRSAALAVAIAAGTPTEEACQRLAAIEGADPSWLTQPTAAEAPALGAILDQQGMFALPGALVRRRDRVHGHLAEAIRAVPDIPAGWALFLSRQLHTGALAEAFVAMVNVGTRRTCPPAYWAALERAAAELPPDAPRIVQVALKALRNHQTVPVHSK